MKSYQVYTYVEGAEPEPISEFPTLKAARYYAKHCYAERALRIHNCMEPPRKIAEADGEIIETWTWEGRDSDCASIWRITQ
jgi:hypothetical protein